MARAKAAPQRSPLPRSPLRWVGGKFYLAKQIAALMPPHQIYCEVFGGAAHVLYRKAPSRSEILNDINGELMNFWQILRDEPDYLMAQAAEALYSRQLFEQYRDMQAAELASLTPRERAWRFFYLVRCCFGVKLNKPTFAYRLESHAAMPRVWPALLAQARERLRRVILECQPWQACLARYDSPQTLFYLDPPYIGFEKYYPGMAFDIDQFAELAERLATLQGAFLLSLNDCPEARELFAAFPIIWQGQARYTLNKGQRRDAGELVFASANLQSACLFEPRRRQGKARASAAPLLACLDQAD